MTACIAAACDNGKAIVTATDGLVSLEDVTGECVLAKIQWKGPWQFMYSGIGGNFDLLMEEIADFCLDNRDALSRRKIQQTVQRAYQKVLSRLCSFEVLSPFDLTMDKFTTLGRGMFSDESHRDLVSAIAVNGTKMQDQVLVTGWGHSPASAMVYAISPTGEELNTSTGFTSIGSGAHMAQTMLVLLGQARHRTVAETIFNAACAKFSSERSGELDVGRATTIHVSRKRKDGDDDGTDESRGFIQDADIDILRGLWEAHLKPRIPDEARVEIGGIASRVDGGASVRDMVEGLSARRRLDKQSGPPS